MTKNKTISKLARRVLRQSKKETTIMFSIRINEELLNAYRKACKQKKVKMGAEIKSFIEAYVEASKKVKLSPQ